MGRDEEPKRNVVHEISPQPANNDLPPNKKTGHGLGGPTMKPSIQHSKQPLFKNGRNFVFRPRHFLRAQIWRIFGLILVTGHLLLCFVFTRCFNFQMLYFGILNRDFISLGLYIFLLIPITFIIILMTTHRYLWPIVTISQSGITLRTGQSLLAMRWASFDMFIMRIEKNRFKRIESTIVGPDIPNLIAQQRITLLDRFDTPIEEILEIANAHRAESLITNLAGDNTAIEPPKLTTPPSPKYSSIPWATICLVDMMASILTLSILVRNQFPPLPLDTVPCGLYHFGSATHFLVAESGEWYRIFSASLLHLGWQHWFNNSIFLILAGALLESIIGPIWILNIFGLAALGSMIIGLDFSPAPIGLLGSSGAVIGVFMGCVVIGTAYDDYVRPTQLLRFVLAGFLLYNFRGQLEAFCTKLVPSGLMSFKDEPVTDIFRSDRSLVSISIHFGGFLAGSVASLFYCQLLKSPRQRFYLNYYGWGITSLFLGALSIAIYRIVTSISACVT